MTEILNFELLHINTFVITIGNIVMVLVTILGIHLLYKLLSAIIRRTFRSRAVPEGRQTSILQLVSYFVWVMGFIIGIQMLGVDITFIIASSAALLVGIGLGLQNVFKDFVAGIIVLLDGTIKSDDIVEIDGWVVKVIEVNLRTSDVLTREDKIVIVPNHKFIDENVVNWTHNATPTRFSIEVGVDYSSDIDLVSKLLIDCTLQHTDILQSAPYGPSVRLSNFGSSSLDFELIFWSNNLFRIEQSKSKLRFTIFRAFAVNHITIPYSQVVLHGAEKIMNK